MEIQLYNQITDPVKAIDQLGTMFAKSGMFGCDNENAGKMLAMICLAERQSPTYINRNFDIVGGKLRKKSMAAFAEFRQAGGKVRWLKTGEDGKEASAEFTFEGQTVQLSFTIEQARQGGANIKDGSNWTKTPGNMLRARVISNALGMLCPEIFAGDDVGNDIQQVAPEMKLAGPVVAATPPAAPAAPPAPAVTPSNVIEIKADVQPVPAPPEPPEPVQTPPPAALTAEQQATVAALENAIGDAGPAAMKWFLAQGWLQPGEGLECLKEIRVKQILTKTPAFLRAVKGAA